MSKTYLDHVALLMQPIGRGLYERALAKRGPGLQHLAVRTANLLDFSTSHSEFGWLLHPRSVELLEPAAPDPRPCARVSRVRLRSARLRPVGQA